MKRQNHYSFSRECEAKMTEETRQKHQIIDCRDEIPFTQYIKHWWFHQVTGKYKKRNTRRWKGTVSPGAVKLLQLKKINEKYPEKGNLKYQYGKPHCQT